MTFVWTLTSVKIAHRTIAGFDWDRGNREKCQIHGVSIRDIEEVFGRGPAIEPDSFVAEERLRAIGTTSAERYVFLVFTLRVHDGATCLRPISARDMHLREVRQYEEEKDSDVQER